MTAAVPALEELTDKLEPFWLWDADRHHIAWANRAAIALWGEPTLLDLLEHDFDPEDPLVLRLNQIAREAGPSAEMSTPLAPSRPVWLPIATLRGMREMACRAHAWRLDDGRPGVLVETLLEGMPDGFSRFGEMVRRVPLALCLFSETGALLYRNEAANRMLGHHRLAQIVDGVAAHITLASLLAGDADLSAQLIGSAQHTGTASRVVDLDTPIGRRAHRLTLRRVHDPDTGAGAFVAMFRDVATQRQSPRVTGDPQHSIRPLLDLVSDFQWTSDEALRLTSLTGRFEETTGIPAETVLGQSWAALAAKKGAASSPVWAALATRAPWRDLPLTWPSNSGSGGSGSGGSGSGGSGEKDDAITLLLSALPRFDAAGHFSGWHGLGRLSRAPHRTAPPAPPDPSPSKLPLKPPADLSSEQMAADALIDAFNEGVVLLDGQAKILKANKAALRLLNLAAPGNAPGDGDVFLDFFAPDDRPKIQDYFDTVQGRGLAGAYASGLDVTSVQDVPLKLALGRLTGARYGAFLRDMTAEKRTETELRDALAAAEAASDQKSDFLAKISHELRTPLTAIIGFSEAMREERFGPIGNEKYVGYVSDIHHSGELLLSLINDLLDLSKITAGHFEPAFEQVILRPLIEGCVNLIKPSAADRRISIRMAIDDTLPPIVADPRSLRQILLNLLSNAVKFTRAGGQVNVTAALDNTGTIVLTITDTGIGMSAPEVARALEPFRQIDSALSRGQRGTGLGLPLAKALTEANKASFSIKSAPDAGTAVEIRFPSTQVLQD